MSINNMEAFTGAVWDWSILKGCFGNSISPSDIDGYVERRGHFLYIEAKGPNANLSRGQEIALKNRVRDGISTFIVVWGEQGQPEKIRVYYPAPYLKIEEHKICNLDTLRDICVRWFAYANSTAWSEALLKAVAKAEAA